MQDILRQDWFWWSLAIILGFPLLSLILGQFLYGLVQRNSPIAYIIRIGLNVLLPLTALFIFVRFVYGTTGDNLWSRIILTIVSMVAIYAAQALFNALFFGAAAPESWRARTPKLLRDIILSIMIVMGAAFVAATVWDQNVGGIFAALGIGSVILGFALQETLGNVMLGLSLLLERPFTEGDFVEVGGVRGSVSEINWRTVRLKDKLGNNIIVPHGIAAKDKIINYSRADRITAIEVNLGFAYEHPPNDVRRMLRETVLSTPGAMHEPEPDIELRGFGDSSINYTVEFFVDGKHKKFEVQDDFMTRVWYAAKRDGIGIPFPIRTVYHYDGERYDAEASRRNEGALQQQKFLGGLVDKEALDTHCKGAKLLPFPEGDVMLQQDKNSLALYCIVSGRVQLTAKPRNGVDEVIYDLRAGDFFGETVVASLPSFYGAKAATDVQLLALTSQHVENMIEEKPSLAVEIGQIMDIRRRAIAEHFAA